LAFKEKYQNLEAQLEEYQKKEKKENVITFSQNVSGASSSDSETSTKSNEEVIK
jgi:hypothetical protein